ncbi:MAG: hypothetical protein C0467_07020 [Planctomycetaceae bacterium]|nr:hypothetical protein [Planctomycetaceae bacterium]
MATIEDVAGMWSYVACDFAYLAIRHTVATIAPIFPKLTHYRTLFGREIELSQVAFYPSKIVSVLRLGRCVRLEHQHRRAFDRLPGGFGAIMPDSRKTIIIGRLRGAALFEICERFRFESAFGLLKRFIQRYSRGGKVFGCFCATHECVADRTFDSVGIACEFLEQEPYGKRVRIHDGMKFVFQVPPTLFEVITGSGFPFLD